MKTPGDWKFAVEIHPAKWHFPAGKSWVAGWICTAEGNAVTDVRAWIDQRPFLGLHGLPRPEIEQEFLGRAGPPYAGFSFLLEPQRHAEMLRLEACDLEGNWVEFFRTTISAAPDSRAAPEPRRIAELFAELAPGLLRHATRRPDRTLASLANEILAAALAEPLNAFPNPPFAGALEEPTALGRVRDGRVSITGWLAHETARIVWLTALIDPLQEVVLPHGLPRTDITGEFPGLVDHAAAAFVGQVDLPARLNAPVLLKIFATLDSGEKYLVFAQRFKPEILAGAVRPLPIVSGLQFARASWALVNSARSRGLNSRGLLGAAAQAWRHYPAKHRKRSATPRLVANDSTPLRILAVTHNLNFEGAPRLLLELAHFLIRQPGISVQVVSPQEGPLRALFEAAGMKVTVLNVAPALAGATADAFHRELIVIGGLIDWSAVDLVLANTMVSFWAVHLARRAGKPSVLYVHESAPIARLFAPLVPSVLFPEIEAAFGLATRVAFTADASRQVFAALDRGNFRVLPSWLDVAAIRNFTAANDKAALRRQYGYEPGAILLLNLGTVCERKGQHTFIHAAELLEPEFRKKYPDRKIEFLLVGAREDAYLAMLREQVAAAGLQDVRFVPETRENFAYHRMADVLVCTSFEESSPRVLLEAAAFGTPIVSTDVNGIPEMLTGHEAWLVEAGDRYHLAAALRSALAALFAGDNTRAKLANAVVTQRFDEQVSLPRHLALIRDAAIAHR